MKNTERAAPSPHLVPELTSSEAVRRNEFTEVIERDGDWFIARCPEVRGANGQGKTVEESRTSLAEAIALILEDRRETTTAG